MEFKNYYDILGVPKTASDDDIRKAFRKLARKYHPDVSKEADAESKMRDLNEASDVLRDKEKRAAYDALAEQVARGGAGRGGAGGNPGGASGFQPPPGWDAGFEFNRASGGGPADHAEFSDFFSSMFGAGERRGAARQALDRRGEDHHAAIEISLEDAFAGGEREISLRGLENDAQGQPHYQTRTLRVAIPPGVRPGQFVRLAKQGLPGYGKGEPGDLFLEVRIAAHPRIRIDGRDLTMDLPVTPSEAALGAQVQVPIPGAGGGSVVEVTVPPNARGGLKLRLKGRGFKGDPAGDLYLLVQIVLPPADNDAVRAAYQQLASVTTSFDPRGALK